MRLPLTITALSVARTGKKNRLMKGVISNKMRSASAGPANNPTHFHCIGRVRDAPPPIGASMRVPHAWHRSARGGFSAAQLGQYSKEGVISGAYEPGSSIFSAVHHSINIRP